jgi:hypothetical protein
MSLLPEAADTIRDGGPADDSIADRDLERMGPGWSGPAWRRSLIGFARQHALARGGQQRACGCCNPGDFTRWKEHDAYQKALDRLLRDLRVERG